MHAENYWHAEMDKAQGQQRTAEMRAIRAEEELSVARQAQAASHDKQVQLERNLAHQVWPANTAIQAYMNISRILLLGLPGIASTPQSASCSAAMHTLIHPCMNMLLASQLLQGLGIGMC